MKTVQCPVCDQAVVWSAQSPWRPFCSERCKMIDLGDWAAEKHVIAGDAAQATGVAPDAANSDRHDTQQH
ncbi:MAG TPA: DNA gyrase inhibitor YacG [Burkholderiaceae bacterium]|nr:DNA gyrase inhibitor YacG [Burkholderiaceae bacterium]